MINDLPSPEMLRKLLRYDPKTGKMFWRYRPRELCASQGSYLTWNKRFSGKEAFKAKKIDGYKRLKIFGTNYQAHRVVWAVVKGAWPNGEIDHINGIRDDNRIENLRDVSRKVNCRNMRKKRNNTSGYNGVYWIGGKWRASICLDGKLNQLGAFDDIESAAAARSHAERIMGFTERHGK